MSFWTHPVVGDEPQSDCGDVESVGEQHEDGVLKVLRIHKFRIIRYELSISNSNLQFVDQQLVDKIKYLHFQLLVISAFLKLKHVE